VDFEYHYSEEQERFRSEVLAWLDANLPQELKDSGDVERLDQAALERSRAFQRKLGEKGWLAPTEPVEWGGGGLTPDHALVIIEELGKNGLRWLLEQGNASLRRSIQQWGTDEQKSRYLPEISAGQATLWHHSMEAGAELDPDSLGVQAFLEGDDYILDGRATFVGIGDWPDYLWTLAVTDPDAPPSKRTAAFMVPAGLEGISIQTPDTLVPGQTHHVTFDRVWVPTNCLVGDEGGGWSLMQSTLLEEQAIEYPAAYDEDVAGLIKYASETNRYGVAISKHLFFQQLLMEVYINSERIRIFRVRNAWMADTGQELTYHVAQVALMEKQSALRLSQVVREIMGIYALLGPSDPLAPMRGRYQLHQRKSLAQQNPNDGPESQAAAIAKHLGLDPLEGKGVEPATRGTATGLSPSQ
jgi:alkylation response protein AidB-like acyl-CoA dehydrogenase